MSVFGAPHSIDEINTLFAKVTTELGKLDGDINKLKAQHKTTSQTANANEAAVVKLTAEIATLKATHSAEVDEIYAKIAEIDKKVQESDQLLVKKEQELEGQANGAGTTDGSGAAKTQKRGK